MSIAAGVQMGAGLNCAWYMEDSVPISRGRNINKQSLECGCWLGDLCLVDAAILQYLLCWRGVAFTKGLVISLNGKWSWMMWCWRHGGEMLAGNMGGAAINCCNYEIQWCTPSLRFVICCPHVNGLFTDRSKVTEQHEIYEGTTNPQQCQVFLQYMPTMRIPCVMVIRVN